jgi:hypothetical protein
MFAMQMAFREGAKHPGKTELLQTALQSGRVSEAHPPRPGPVDLRVPRAFARETFSLTRTAPDPAHHSGYFSPTVSAQRHMARPHWCAAAGSSFVHLLPSRMTTRNSGTPLSWMIWRSSIRSAKGAWNSSIQPPVNEIRTSGAFRRAS